ncbi:MAG: TlpA family protein disulfide reductase [Lachnospiraceae bacterium]|nr:TlpA family protein disulfide reductase [Lachnospiraceae bacterium]
MKNKHFLAMTLPALLLLSGCSLFVPTEHPNPNATVPTVSAQSTTDVTYSDPSESGTLTMPGHVKPGQITQDDIDSGSTPSDGNNDNALAPDGSASGTFSTTDLYGNPYTEEVFTHAKINFVNIWGTFCGPCIMEMPDLGELSHEYDPSDVQFIGIVCDVYSEYHAKPAFEIIDETGADYLHLVTNESINNWKLNEVDAVPTTLIIDSYGNILYTTVGSDSKENWKAVIDTYLNQ